MESTSGENSSSSARSIRIRKRLKELRERWREELRPVDPPPRYDDIFFEGLEWLDKL